MREIVLELKAPQSWVSEVTSNHPTTIRVLDCKPVEEKDGVRQLVEVTADPSELHQVVEKIKTSPLVKEAYVVETKRGKVVGSVLTQHAFCSMVSSSEAFCRTCLFHAKPKPDGTVEWTLAFNNRQALTELLDRMEKDHVDVRILRLSSLAGVENLTSHQKRIVETALEEGFFDYPRRISLRDLAKKLGSSSATVSEVLRRAEKKILTAYSRPGGVEGFQENDSDTGPERSLEEQILKNKHA